MVIWWWYWSRGNCDSEDIWVWCGRGQHLVKMAVAGKKLLSTVGGNRRCWNHRTRHRANCPHRGWGGSRGAAILGGLWDHQGRVQSSARGRERVVHAGHWSRTKTLQLCSSKSLTQWPGEFKGQFNTKYLFWVKTFELWVSMDNVNYNIGTLDVKNIWVMWYYLDIFHGYQVYQ